MAADGVTHVPRRVGSTYTVAYECACGWASEEVQSEQIAVIGAQLVRHMTEGNGQ